MKEVLQKINWKELFFPVLGDIKNVNEDTDSERVSTNNWNLANDDENYQIVETKIEEARKVHSHNVIIL